MTLTKQKLIPYQVSDRGPAVEVSDLNNDGMDDIFFGGSKHQPAKIFYQTQKGFFEREIKAFKQDSVSEDISVIAEDFNKDGSTDLFVVSGGGEFSGESSPLQDRLYIGKNGTFEKTELPSYFENGSIVKAADFDKDGDVDLFVGGAAVPNDFGRIPQSFLLINNNGRFTIADNDNVKTSGMVTDAEWTDFDGDGWIDLIVIGEWMSPKFFRNNRGNLEDVTSDYLMEELRGLWQTIIPFDINGDGNMDYLLGNWGLNSKFSATKEFPLKMYYSDFDGNGSTETITTYAREGKYYTVAGLDELVGQLSYLRKKFPSYKDFAGKSIEDIFDKAQLNKSNLLEVNTLSSGYLLNFGEKYTFKPFKENLQVAPITSFLAGDFNNDGKEEVLIGGNYFGVTPYHGRLSSLAGNVIVNEKTTIEGNALGLNFTQKAVRNLKLINFQGAKYLMVIINNDTPQFYKLDN
ncbi:VCBS repeat-containing protein [Antarcticibacterium sp. 1MA-6-2]|uniref:FG-GAP repeat domain-containing protein n=1 Tax=Antarcticibacterium sp. 1MA-6-2 TaxID=2908210 RepID=UPI002882E15B|nr:VCBS repeat-containing protein [Antarcticibacterium sp. 1MA-6-2]